MNSLTRLTEKSSHQPADLEERLSATERSVAITPEGEPERPEISDRLEHHAEPRTTRGSSSTWKVRHTNLCNGYTRGAELNE